MRSAAKKNSKIIEIRDLHKNFGEKSVLSGVNLDVDKGSSMVILGTSGTGKSVLIKSIIGLIEPDSGSIKIQGQDTTFLSESQRFILMKKCGYLFQGGALFDSMTIEENVLFFAEKLYKMSKAEKHELAAEKIHSVGLHASVLKQYPSELSGGMQKRAALARTICTDPEIIFFDEPTTGLDPIMSNVINDLIIKTREELGATTITITHDINSANRIASNIAMLNQGKILWHGSKDEMQNSDNDYINQFIHGLSHGPITIDA